MVEENILPASANETYEMLKKQNFVANDKFAQLIFLALKLNRPILIEGPVGSGKTTSAHAIALALNIPLIKLQCYEGLGVNEAVYEWNYAAQLISIKMDTDIYEDENNRMPQLFTSRYLIKRPLLEALEGNGGKSVVLLIDEIDRADSGFESILLEILAENQFTIPDFGTIKAQTPPVIIITSNGTRSIHNALRRRCFYYCLSWPSFKNERRFIESRLPAAQEKISKMIDIFVETLKVDSQTRNDFDKDERNWIKAIKEFDAFELSPERVNKAFHIYFKYKEKIKSSEGNEISKLLRQSQVEFEDINKK